MKKIFLFIVALFFVQSVLALSSTLGESYSPKETIIFELQGQVQQTIHKEDIKLKRGTVEIAMEYDIKKLDEKYFIWLTAPESSGNYTITINDVHTVVGGVSEVVDYSESFSVDGSVASYSINPGVVFASDDFSIVATVNGDSQETISIDFPSQREISLVPGDNLIDFSVDDVVTGFYTISFGEYSVPAYIIGNGEETVILNETESEEMEGEEEVVESGGNLFEFDVSFIRSTILVGGELPKYSFRITNIDDAKIEDLEIDYNQRIFSISPTDVFDILPGESRDFELSYIAEPGQGFRETVVAHKGNASRVLVLVVNLTSSAEEASTETYEEDEGQRFYYCTELGGVLCGARESCSGSEVDSVDGDCCIGECEESSGSSYSWLGWLLGLLAILVGIYVFQKYRKTGSSGSSAVSERFASAESGLP